MKTLVVGGSGLIGARAALHLQETGHEVTLAARRPTTAGPPTGTMPFRRVDYLDPDLTPDALAGFDALVFSAGHDTRIETADTPPDYWHRVNSVGIPRFFAIAKEAGIARAVNIGSYYPQAAPHLVEGNAYIRSRLDSVDGIAALADDGFRASSVNAPFVIGAVPGLVTRMFVAYTRYAEGAMPDIPVFAPPGGVNFISARSLAEAAAGALRHGEPGGSYLVGDENLTWQAFFGLFFTEVGREPPPIVDREHPLLPDAAIPFGRGNTLFYEPDAAVVGRLGYRRNDVAAAAREIVARFRG